MLPTQLWGSFGWEGGSVTRVCVLESRLTVCMRRHIARCSKRKAKGARTSIKMKVRSSIKAMCKNCYIVRRGKTRYVYCKTTPKHHQRQGVHTSAREGAEETSFSGFCALCGIAGGGRHQAAAHLGPSSLRGASSAVSSPETLLSAFKNLGIGSVLLLGAPGL